MAKLKRWIPLSIVAFSVLVSGIILGQQSFAVKKDAASIKAEKAETLKKLIAEEAVERAKLEAMPNQTQEEIKKTVEQGMKVKQLGLQAAALQAELEPEDMKKRVQEDIRSLKDIFNGNKYYADRVNDPIHGPKYQKAYAILQQKVQILEQIEQDFLKNTKPLEQLHQEIDDLRKIRELE